MPVLRTIWLTWAAPALVAGEPPQILYNARVWTGDPAQPRTVSVAVEGKRIADVGANAAVLALRGSGTRVVAAQGRMVMPGSNDAHIHFFEAHRAAKRGRQTTQELACGRAEQVPLCGSGLDEVNLTGACWHESMLGRVRNYAEAHPDSGRIFGRSWEDCCFPGQRLPVREDLDAVVRDRPVYLAASGERTTWVNTAALRRAEITRDTRCIGFGGIVRDAAGEPTGRLKEEAQGLVRRHAPPVTRERKLAALRHGMRLGAPLGITSIQNASGEDAEIKLYEELERQGELTLRVYPAPSVSPRSGPALPKKRAGERLRVGAIKLMLDGVTESHTAVCSRPTPTSWTRKGRPPGRRRVSARRWRRRTARAGRPSRTPPATGRCA